MQRNDVSVGVFLELICFCHLRWDFVYQRPQHLLTRFGMRGRVHFWEEPIFDDADHSRLVESAKGNGVTVLTPILQPGLNALQIAAAQRKLLDTYVDAKSLGDFVAWYYTPMALQFSDHLRPAAIVYDCMDELSAFQGAPPELVGQEAQLFARADVVFAGGASLFESKRKQHGNAHFFPSSIDRSHFAAARKAQEDPLDQSEIPYPRIGFYGVLDERLDQELLREVAAAHPEWHFVLLGPVVKIRMEDLPTAKNIHYLGQKTYAELPQYLANWDVAMLPFARNASTRFISPTKTPEYLAGGKPVVSTPIQDVIKPYGELGLVRIGANAEEFAAAIQQSLEPVEPGWLERVDKFLGSISWDITFGGMWKEIQRVIPQGQVNSAPNTGQR